MRISTPFAAASMLLLLPAAAPAADLLWYGGDAYAVGWVNNSRLTISKDAGCTAWDDFVVTDPAGWHVTALFSNNLATYPIEADPITQAYWSLRVADGTAPNGTPLAGGAVPCTVTPTGRTYEEGRIEYTVQVTGLAVDLAPGTYFVSVSPVSTFGVYDLGDSSGTNAVGTAGPSGIVHLTGHDPILVYDTMPRASLGVVGTVIPEPATAPLAAAALWAVITPAGRRRRCRVESMIQG